MSKIKTKLAKNHIAITGELTVYTTPLLKGKLLTGLSAAQELELDLSEVDEFDSAGLHLLVTMKQKAAILGKVLHFTSHSDAVLDFLDFTGLSVFFEKPQLVH